jgi:tetratricopeptide (TPR) repeat protein
MKAKRDYWFWAFAVLTAGLFFVLPLLSLGAGNSGDEDMYQIPQGNYVLDFYGTGGRDTTCLGFENLKYYGASFDVATAFVNRTFGVEAVHVTRHVCNSLFGWLAMVFAGLIAVRAGGWRAGVMTVAILFLSPRFLGHAFNNPKDTPFAAAIVMGCYFMMQFFSQFPKVRKRTAAGLVLSIALAISIRIGGLILVGYFGVFGAAYLAGAFFGGRRRTGRVAAGATGVRAWRLAAYAAVICVAGYFLGLVLWPYALQSPFVHPLRAFREMSHFAIAVGQLFEGNFTPSNNLPWYYTPKYILLTVPLAVFAGVVAYPAAGGLKRGRRLATFMIYFAFIFPVFWIVYTKANVYGGWRHAMFAYPPMAVAAGLGFSGLAGLAKNRYVRMALAVLPFAMLAGPAAHIVRNHPYEYVYFNGLAGGMDRVYGNYEMDYYYHSTREAAEWVRDHAERSGLEEGERIVVGSWHEPSVGYFLRRDTARFETVFMRWRERSTKDWDYAIFPVTGMTPQVIKSAHFPPLNTVHTIRVDGRPICLILRNVDKSAYHALRARARSGTDGTLGEAEREALRAEAVAGFRRALEVDPYDDYTLILLADMYFFAGRIDSSIYYVDRLISYFPDENNINFAANMYEQYVMSTKDMRYMDPLIALRRRMIADFPLNPKYYYTLAMIYAARGEGIAGKKLMDTSMERNRGIFDAYYYMAMYMAQTGDREGAMRVLNVCRKKFPVEAPALQKALELPDE